MEIENPKSLFINDYTTKDIDVIEMKHLNFQNPDYILKHNMNSNLKFFKDELTIKYIGKGNNTIDYASVQSTKPINKLHSIFYFEVEILDEGSKRDITIGLSDKEFVLNKQCGTTSKSYGLHSDGKIFHDKSKGDSFTNKFKTKDVIGCGFYFSKNSIFFTINGKFINWAFNNVEFNNYYPTVSLHSLNEKIAINFGKQNFLFDVEGFHMNEMKQKINEVINEEIKLSEMDYVIREYLVHSGYQETFMALEDEHAYTDGKIVPDTEIEEQMKKELQNVSWRKDSFEGLKDYNNPNYFQMELSDDNIFTIEKLRKYSTDEIGLNEPSLRKRTLSIVMDRITSLDEIGLDEQGNRTKSHDIFLIMNFLKERKIIQNMIKEKDYEMALNYFESNFSAYKNTKEFIFKKIIVCLVCLNYLKNLSQNEYLLAYKILKNMTNEYFNKDITISLYDNDNKLTDYNLENLSVLLCYENILSSDLKYFFSEKQTMLISDQINSLILELSGLSNESILEKILKQENLSSIIYRTIKHCPNEKLVLNFNKIHK